MRQILIQFIHLSIVVARSSSKEDCDVLLQECRSCSAPVLDISHDCPLSGFDCSDSRTLLSLTTDPSLPSEDCLRLICADPNATLFVERDPMAGIVCSGKAWNLESDLGTITKSALCAKKCGRNHCGIDGTRKQNLEIHDSSITSPCASAECVGILVGIDERGNETELKGQAVTCRGNGSWITNDGLSFAKVACAGCSNCPTSNRTGDPSKNCIMCPSSRSDVLLTKASGDPCNTASCTDGNALIGVDEHSQRSQYYGLYLGPSGTAACNSKGKWTHALGYSFDHVECMMYTNFNWTTCQMPEVSRDTRETPPTALEIGIYCANDEIMLINGTINQDLYDSNRIGIWCSSGRSQWTGNAKNFMQDPFTVGCWKNATE